MSPWTGFWIGLLTLPVLCLAVMLVYRLVDFWRDHIGCGHITWREWVVVERLPRVFFGGRHGVFGDFAVVTRGGWFFEFKRNVKRQLGDRDYWWWPRGPEDENGQFQRRRYRDVCD